MEVEFDYRQGYEQLGEYPMVVFWMHGVVGRDDVGYL